MIFLGYRLALDPLSLLAISVILLVSLLQHLKNLNPFLVCLGGLPKFLLEWWNELH